MNFKFIGNAGGIFTGSKGSKILCDPWIIDGVFEGSWYHYPPVKTKLSDIQNVDAIYISHLHPDHFDERYLEFSKDIPLIVLNEEPNFLKKKLIKMGYNNLIEIKNDETVKFNEFNLTAYKPFVKHQYEESILGDLIDSALVLNDNNITAINFNDNVPDVKACTFLREKFKQIDLVMVNYNSAGPYPSCFDNLNVKEKKKEHNRISMRNLEYLCNIMPALKPKSILTSMGSYILGGKQSYKNEYLGTTTGDECAVYLKENLKIDANIFCLRDNQTFDLSAQKQLDKYEKIDLDEMKNYIRSIKEFKYDYETDNEPETQVLCKDTELAAEKLLERLKRFHLEFKTNVFIEINEKQIPIINGEDGNRKLYCKMDNKLLRRILDRKAHWNNAEIGAHITYKRYPNNMEADVHTVMSFFHL